MEQIILTIRNLFLFAEIVIVTNQTPFLKTLTQKEKSLITLKAIIQESDSNALTAEVFANFVLEKIDSCLDLINPEVLLSMEARKNYDKIIDGLRKQGKII